MRLGHHNLKCRLVMAANHLHPPRMTKPNPALKFVGSIVLWAAAFLGLFWLLFWRG